MGSITGLVGRTGRLVVGTGPGTPGRVRLPFRGGTEDFHAWSDEPLAAGTRVLVVEVDLPRDVHVIPLR